MLRRYAVQFNRQLASSSGHKDILYKVGAILDQKNVPLKSKERQELSRKPVDWIGLDSTYHTEQTVEDVQKSIDPENTIMKIVSLQGRNGIPVIKTFERSTFENKAATAASGANSAQSSGKKGMKTFKLNWSIGMQDISRRIREMQLYLIDGERVRVELGTKKGKTRASTAQRQECLDLILQSLAKVGHQCQPVDSTVDMIVEQGPDMNIIRKRGMVRASFAFEPQPATAQNFLKKLNLEKVRRWDELPEIKM